MQRSGLSLSEQYSTVMLFCWHPLSHWHGLTTMAAVSFHCRSIRCQLQTTRHSATHHFLWLLHAPGIHCHVTWCDHHCCHFSRNFICPFFHWVNNDYIILMLICMWLATNVLTILYNNKARNSVLFQRLSSTIQCFNTVCFNGSFCFNKADLDPQ